MTEELVVVPMGGLEVRAAPAVLTAIGLGSCVAIMMLDPGTRTGGLAHVLLPVPGDAGAVPPGRYAASAAPLLFRQLVATGADPARFQAWLVGGATMFAALMAPDTVSIGDRNVTAAREALDRLGVPIAGEALGGTRGRTVTLDLARGRVEVRSVGQGVHVL